MTYSIAMLLLMNHLVVADCSTCTDDVPELIFYVPFDGDGDATVAGGDRRIFTAPSYAMRSEAKPGLQTGHARLVTEGKSGGSLEFTKKDKPVLLYRASKNIAYSEKSLRGTIAFWLKLDPVKDLAPGYCDPLQITDKKWNDSSFFVDFTDKNPRDFRLGVFADYKFWNPKDVKWDKVPDKQRPLITAKQPPFSKDTWTHVAMTFKGINQSDAMIGFFLNGKQIGTLQRPVKITWSLEQTSIMLGLNYVGHFDELMIFDRPMSPEQIQQLMTAGASSFKAK